VRPFEGHSLSEICKSWKSWKRHTARRINQRVGTSGQFWQRESFDRIVRDSTHLWRALQYIGHNPEKAGVDAPRWLSPTWQELGWRFEPLPSRDESAEQSS
jgi:putative transposase